MSIILRIIVLVVAVVSSGCDMFTDAATRLAYDIEHAAKKLKTHGDKLTLYHETPSKRGACSGPYTVQLDKAGALVIWCKDESGGVLSSPGTSFHSRFVQTSETYYLDKAAGETLVIELLQKKDKVVIVDVR